MKYYSEKLKTLFDSEDSLLEAENKAEAEAKAKEEAAAKEKAELSKAKQTLANAIDIADKQLDDAYAKLQEARDAVDKIYKEAAIEADEILTPAKNAVNEAEKAKRDAIAAFNDKFGVYRKVYDGDKAEKEFNRFINLYNSFVDDFNYLFNI